jgi:DNA-binding CsgD family transcriptional regulator
MFDALIARIVNHASVAGERPEGVAFFRAAKELYGLATVTYFCANIPVFAPARHYAHCVYSDTCVRQFMSKGFIQLFAKADESKPTEGCLHGQGGHLPADHGGFSTEGRQSLVVRLRERHGETAVFGISVERGPAEWSEQKKTIARECRILANYFHGHVLRMNGYDSEGDILLSARELDCLKWTAAGKTAWEASVILGISERTVRFHLNAAREKLKCATTTQAVAKAVGTQLIDV